MKLIQYIKSWFSSRKLSAAMQAASDWEKKAEGLNERMLQHQENLKSHLVTFQILKDVIETDFEKYESLKDQQQTAIEQLRSENRVLAETTIPTLVAQHKLILSRVEAETANQVRLMVAAVGRTSGDEG